MFLSWFRAGEGVMEGEGVGEETVRRVWGRG
jgi:hypothetical protein